MNIYLLQIIGKWIGIIIISITSFFGGINIGGKKSSFDNTEKNKNYIITSEVVKFDTKVEYSQKIPNDLTMKLSEGSDGIVYVDNFGNVKEVVKEVVPDVTLVGTGPVGNYIGRMTGYGPDCIGCSKVGNVACHTSERKNHSLVNDGIVYNDLNYGNVRILAADLTLFPCGTIIEVDNGEDVYKAVVLDTGGAMRSAWRNRNEVLIDLAFSSGFDPDVRFATRSKVNYNVQRWGW